MVYLIILCVLGVLTLGLLIANVVLTKYKKKHSGKGDSN